MRLCFTLFFLTSQSAHTRTRGVLWSFYRVVEGCRAASTPALVVIARVDGPGVLRLRAESCHVAQTDTIQRDLLIISI
jgi:hypothetical protein